jgi:hypothetical protein
VFECKAKSLQKGGKDQGAMTDHTRGLRRKVRTSYEKTPYLDHWDDDLKMTQMKGGQVQNVKMSRREKDGPEPTQKELGPAGSVGSAQGGLWWFGLHFDLVAPRSINSSLLRRLSYPTILLTSFTKKPPPQEEGESSMSSSQGSMPAEGRNQKEDSKLLA